MKKAFADSNKNKKVLIVGLGLHGGGEAAVRWFVKHGAKVRVSDRQTSGQLQSTIKKLKTLPVSWSLGAHRWADFAWADIIVQNPGVPDFLPELKNARRLGKTIVNEATIFFEHCPAKIIGVTGTRGKTTTSLLLGHILRQQFPRTFVSGNVRQTPMLELLDRLRPGDTVVLELSSFQLELLATVRRSPTVAVMTNLLVDHLNRYGTMSAYAQAKYAIVRYQQAGDVAVLNYDSAWVRRAAQITAGYVLWYSMKAKLQPPAITISRGWVVERHGQKIQKILPLSDWHLPGQHQHHNLLAAVAAARALHLRADHIRRGVTTFAGVPSRQEMIRTWRGHAFINDTTATTPDATLAALNVFPRAVFIVGGSDKKLQFADLARDLTRRRTPLVFLPGSATIKLRRALRVAKYRGPDVTVDSMPAAVAAAVSLSKKKQPIVLSPAAASFGLFRHEFDRGDQYVAAVKKLR